MLTEYISQIKLIEQQIINTPEGMEKGATFYIPNQTEFLVSFAPMEPYCPELSTFQIGIFISGNLISHEIFSLRKITPFVIARQMFVAATFALEQVAEQQTSEEKI
jgi:hypothetical protein